LELQEEKKKKKLLMRNVLRPDHIQAYRECYKTGLNNQGFFPTSFRKRYL